MSVKLVQRSRLGSGVSRPRMRESAQPQVLVRNARIADKYPAHDGGGRLRLPLVRSENNVVVKVA
eukprot:4670805-Pleurochrysis_carterae.AAC.9